MMAVSETDGEVGGATGVGGKEQHVVILPAAQGVFLLPLHSVLRRFCGRPNRVAKSAMN